MDEEIYGDGDSSRWKGQKRSIGLIECVADSLVIMSDFGYGRVSYERTRKRK